MAVVAIPLIKQPIGLIRMDNRTHLVQPNIAFSPGFILDGVETGSDTCLRYIQVKFRIAYKTFIGQ